MSSLGRDLVSNFICLFIAGSQHVLAKCRYYLIDSKFIKRHLCNLNEKWVNFYVSFKQCTLNGYLKYL